jgi:hypothetical protein
LLLAIERRLFYPGEALIVHPSVAAQLPACEATIATRYQRDNGYVASSRRRSRQLQRSWTELASTVSTKGALHHLSLAS